MRRILWCALMGSSMLLGAGDGQEKKTEGRNAAQARKVDPAPPEGAVQVSQWDWRYTDPQGKTWLYRKGPFGWSKTEAAVEDKKDEAQPAQPSAPFRAQKPEERGQRPQGEAPAPFRAPQSGDAAAKPQGPPPAPFEAHPEAKKQPAKDTSGKPKHKGKE